MANKYIPDDAAERLEALAKEAGVPLATLLSKLCWFFGEQARDLVAEDRAEEERRRVPPRQGGRTA